MSDSDDENFVTFGEALEPLDEENLPRKKAVTLEDQFAVDAQGRRRFHGAFTGGFSAGYFNSVGTRDGWKPQQFKSSRSSKAGNVSQRPEDFMDEEDTGEFGIAPTGIRATSDFADHSAKGKKRERPRASNDGPIPGVPVLQELLKPVTDTIGVTLLKKMGWKPGQGVGPRQTKKEKQQTRRRNKEKKVYGCVMPGHETKITETDSDTSEDENELLFAPDDYEPFRCNPKDNYFGIGYSGLDRRPVLSGHVNLFDEPAFKMNDKNKKLSIRGQAFGVGAFEADDEDIYARDDMSRYDFSLGPETKKKNRWSNKESLQSKAKCLEGFIPAKNPLEKKKTFNPPELPKDFKPIHSVRISRFSPATDSQSALENGRKKGLGRHDLNSQSRATILGESKPQTSVTIQSSEPTTSQIPSKASPACNIITRTLNLHGRDQTDERTRLESQKSKTFNSWMDRLNVTSFVRGGVEGSNTNSASLQKFEEFKTNCMSVELSNSQTDKTEKPEIHFAKPFIADEEKQKRFEKFLELKNNEKGKLESLQPLSMTEWEREHEREEFEIAAKLFVSQNALKTVENKLGEKSHDENPAMSAAKMKMFGKLTRTIDTWQPASIVCKRFNVPEPQSGCAAVDAPKSKKYSVFESLDFCGGDTKFQKATDTAGTYEEPHIPYKPSDSKSLSKERDKNDDESLSRALDTSDISTGSSDKLRNFEASYEKVFGKGTLVTSGANSQFSNDPQNHKTSNEAETIKLGDCSTSVSQVKDKADEKKDLFKAIFLSSSEGSDSENEPEEIVDSDTMKNLLIGKPRNELNVQRNTSPPRGIFAQLDLDDLLAPGTSKSKDSTKDDREMKKLDESAVVCVENKDVNESLNKVSSSLTTECEMDILPDMYGPALPDKSERIDNQMEDVKLPKPIFKSVVTKLNNSKVELKWVERSKSKKSKKEKKKHKQKDKEKKHKHKSKKKKH